MQKAVTVVGPQDDGRRMSLAKFGTAEGREGHFYELSRGVVTVVDVPSRRHLAQVIEIQQQFFNYRSAHSDRVHTIAGGAECKILLEDLESERHPDVAIYKTAAEPNEDWSSWVPEVVIEGVSPGSETRDDEEKPPEYLAFGVMEYWIVDAAKEEVLTMRRSGGKWAKRVLKGDEKYKTRLLPGFEFDVAAVFPAARREWNGGETKVEKWGPDRSV